MKQNFNFRSIKSSFKDHVTLPAWDALFKNWRNKILTEFGYIWKGETRELCGVAMDPVQFIKNYLLRFLSRRKMEGDLPHPGHYKIKIKVSYNWVLEISSIDL